MVRGSSCCGQRFIPTPAGHQLVPTGDFVTPKSDEERKFQQQVGLVNSSKIVHHQNGTVYYTFTFSDVDSVRLIGVHFNPKAKAPAAASK